MKLKNILKVTTTVLGILALAASQDPFSFKLNKDVVRELKREESKKRR